MHGQTDVKKGCL